jgi:hypothetical protein
LMVHRRLKMAGKVEVRWILARIVLMDRWDWEQRRMDWKVREKASINIHLLGTRQFKLTRFTAPWVHSTCYSVPGAHYHTPKWTPGSRLCYSAGTRRLPSPQSMEAQHPSLSLTAKDYLLLLQKARMPDSPQMGGKLWPATLQEAPEALFPQGAQKLISSHYAISLQESHISSVQELELQLLHWVAISYSAGARRPVPQQYTETSAPHCDYRRAPASPSKSRNSNPLAEGRKEVICSTARTLHGAP